MMMMKKKKKTALCCDHRMAAIQDMNRAHELTSQLHAVLLHLLPPGFWSQVGGDDIVKEILKLTSSVISRLQSACCRSSSSSSSSDGSHEDDPRIRNKHAAGRKRKSSSLERRDRPDGDKRRRKQETCSIVTAVPYEDGHQWRKYGQKAINNYNYQRSYYRCTYKEQQGCQAKKTVQQLDQDNYCADHGDSPQFRVEYIAQHTCKTIDSTVVVPFVMESAAPKEEINSSPVLLHGISCTSSSLKLQDQQHYSNLNSPVPLVNLTAANASHTLESAAPKEEINSSPVLLHSISCTSSSLNLQDQQHYSNLNSPGPSVLTAANASHELDHETISLQSSFGDQQLLHQEWQLLWDWDLFLR